MACDGHHPWCHVFVFLIYIFISRCSKSRMDQPEIVWSCLHCNSAMLARAYVHNCMFQGNQGLEFEEGTT